MKHARTIVCTMALLIALGMGQARAAGQDAFRPVLLETNFAARTARPGGPLSVSFTFVNKGSAAPDTNYRVFLHFEHPDASCSDIVFQGDHEPTHPTTTWDPGEEITDGPRVIRVSEDAAEGEYHVHVGLFDPDGDGRVLGAYEGTVTVSRDAQPAEDLGPEPLAENKVKARQRRLAERLEEPVMLEQKSFRFSIDPDAGAFELVDLRTGVRWTSNPINDRIGSVELERDGKVRVAMLQRFPTCRRTSNGLQLAAPLLVGEKDTGLELRTDIRTVDNPPGLRFRWDVSGEDRSQWTVRNVRLLDHAFGTTEADAGYSVLPFRMGELMHADNGLPRNRSMLTYNGTSMAFYGAVKRGASLLVAWKHPETELTVHRTWGNYPLVPGTRMVSMSLEQNDGAREFTVHPLGKGDYVDIAKAYRPLARRHGWLETWSEKRQDFPSVDRMFGAADFKPFVLTRTIPGSRYNKSGKEEVGLHYTFEEAAKVAEHLHSALNIDKAMYVLAGWIHRGYDNQHPDILPAAPECGGNDALTDCSERVRDCGFLFGLHDNYQDMYKDAPSWDLEYINKNAQGEPKQGGNWAGGQAWQVCAIKQVELASRPQNLPKVEELFHPTIYFIDTVFAWPLVTCEDPNHPMDRADDMKWKSRLCEVAKKHFNLFGSEEGREWAVPHADYFEGLFSHKVSAGEGDRGFARHAGGTVVPLFEMIYGDCLNLYCHQGDRGSPGRPGYVLDHLVCAENALYRLGSHLYYKRRHQGNLPVTVEVDEFTQTGPRPFRVTYRWKALEGVERDFRSFVHFTHPQGDEDRENIAFQDDHNLPTSTSGWKAGDTVKVGPRTIEIPEQYDGEIAWWIGLTGKGGRATLRDARDDRYRLGTLVVEDGKIRFRPASHQANGPVFARGDRGWGQDLIPTDRYIKNTYEVLSWTNRLTAETPMTDHEFTGPEGQIEHSEFGNVHIWVNHGDEPYKVQTPRKFRSLTATVTTLPRYGFVVLSPRFAAFHATSFGGTEYDEPVLFTARSLDDQPLWDSQRIRAYHGFGDPRVKLCGQTYRVERESVLKPSR